MTAKALNTAHRLMLKIAALRQEKATLNAEREYIVAAAPFNEVIESIDRQIATCNTQLAKLGKRKSPK